MPNLTPHAYSGRQSAHGTTARPAAVSASGPRAKAPKPNTAALWDPPSGATARPLESLASLSGLPTADYGRGFLALKIGCGDRIRTCDLQFMRLASYRAPRRRPVRWPFRASLSGMCPLLERLACRLFCLQTAPISRKRAVASRGVCRAGALLGKPSLSP